MLLVFAAEPSVWMSAILFSRLANRSMRTSDFVATGFVEGLLQTPLMFGMAAVTRTLDAMGPGGIWAEIAFVLLKLVILVAISCSLASGMTASISYMRRSVFR
jgi:hypothetical protein